MSTQLCSQEEVMQLLKSTQSLPSCCQALQILMTAVELAQDDAGIASWSDYAHLHPTVPLMKLPIANSCSMHGTDGEGRNKLQSQWLQVAKGGKDTLVWQKHVGGGLSVIRLQKAHASIQGEKSHRNPPTHTRRREKG